jgi:hypothetical protein
VPEKGGGSRIPDEAAGRSWGGAGQQGAFNVGKDGWAMVGKCKSSLARNWKRLAVANLSSFAVQGVLFAGLVFAGLDTVASLAGAKAASWATFLAAVCRKG